MSEKTERVNFDITLKQSSSALAFGTDAILLAAYLRRASGVACELGTGSGIVSLLALSRGKIKSVTAYELQPEIARIASENAVENGFSEQMRVECADIRLLPQSENGKYKSVFANPPYMNLGSGKQCVETENELSRREANGTVADFCAAASRLLCSGGTFTLCFRPDRLDALIAALWDAKLAPKRLTVVYPTAEHRPSLVLIEAKKDASPGLFFTKPLIIYSSPAFMTQSGYTPDMKHIYESGDFDDKYKKP